MIQKIIFWYQKISTIFQKIQNNPHAIFLYKKNIEFPTSPSYGYQLIVTNKHKYIMLPKIIFWYQKWLFFYIKKYFLISFLYQNRKWYVFWYQKIDFLISKMNFTKMIFCKKWFSYQKMIFWYQKMIFLSKNAFLFDIKKWIYQNMIFLISENIFWYQKIDEPTSLHLAPWEAYWCNVPIPNHIMSTACLSMPYETHCVCVCSKMQHVRLWTELRANWLTCLCSVGWPRNTICFSFLVLIALELKEGSIY